MSHQPPPFGLEDPVAGAAAQVEWGQSIRAISGSIPGDEPEVWLGQLVLLVQQASDRAIAMARIRADALIAEARTDAITIREVGRQRAHAIGQLRAVIRQPALGTSMRPSSPDLGVLPPAPQAVRTRSSAESGAAGVRRPPPAARRPPPVARKSTARATADTPTKPNPLTQTKGARPSTASGMRRSQPRAAARPPAPASHGRTNPDPDAADAGRENAGRENWPAGRLSSRPTVVLVVAAVMVAILGLAAFESYGTARRYRGSQKHLVAELASVEGRSRVQARPTVGAAFGLLSIPRLDINGQAVVEGATLGQLRRGPAHDSASPLPGQRGAVVIIGHRRTYGGPFGRLGGLRIGDVISVRTPAGMYVYRVSRNPQVVHPGPGATLQMPSVTESQPGVGATKLADQAVVLATGVGSRSNAIEVVVATLDQASTGIAPATPAPGGVVARVRSIPGEGVGIVFVAWWSTILGGAIYGSRRLRMRYSPALVYAIGSVVGLLAVYQVYLAVDRMVPGTY